MQANNVNAGNSGFRAMLNSSAAFRFCSKPIMKTIAKRPNIETAEIDAVTGIEIVTKSASINFK